MNRILVLAALGTSLFLPSAAFALDSFDSLSLANQTFDPATMTCGEFMGASPAMKMFVSSWYDGDATYGDVYDLQYSRTDVLDMQANLIKSCGETPNETLKDLYFDYGGTEDDYENATCQMFNSINNVSEAANLLGWTIGYYAYSLDSTSINGTDLVSMGNEIIPLCAAAPEDQLTRHMWSALGLGTPEEFYDYYGSEDDGWSGDYTHTPIDFTIPSYYYDKNIMN